MSDDLRLDEPGELAHVYSEIRGERARQDAKWGGPEHDSQHRPVDWFRYIVEHATLALEALHTSDQPAAEYRRRMIEVAALAVAAIEAEDRADSAGGRAGMSDDLRLDEPGELAAHLADAGEVPAQRIGYRSGIWPLEWHCHFCDADVRPHVMLIVGGISWYCPKCGENFNHESTASLDGIERMRVMQALHWRAAAQEGGR